MNFSELREAFETYTNATDEVDAAQLALWMNEALLDLAYELGPVKKIEVEVEAGEEYQPGIEWLRVVHSDIDFCRQPDGALKFLTGGSGKIYFRELPTPFSGTDSGQQSGLHPALHHLPALFAASRYWDQECDGDAEESSLAAKWLSYYYQGKNLARARLDNASWDIDSWRVS